MSMSTDRPQMAIMNKPYKPGKIQGIPMWQIVVTDEGYKRRIFAYIWAFCGEKRPREQRLHSKPITVTDGSTNISLFLPTSYISTILSPRNLAILHMLEQNSRLLQSWRHLNFGHPDPPEHNPSITLPASVVLMPYLLLLP